MQMHAAMKAGVCGLQVLRPHDLRPLPPLLLGEHVMEALVVAAQHSLEITDSVNNLLFVLTVASHSLDVLFELLIIYPLQPLRSLAHRSLETGQFAGHLRYFSR